MDWMKAAWSSSSLQFKFSVVCRLIINSFFIVMVAIVKTWKSWKLSVSTRSLVFCLITTCKSCSMLYVRANAFANFINSLPSTDIDTHLDLYGVCSINIANFEFSRAPYIQISILMWSHVGMLVLMSLTYTDKLGHFKYSLNFWQLLY